MKRIAISEFGRIYRGDRNRESVPAGNKVYLEARFYRKLHRLDRRLSKNGQEVFTWYADYVQAKQWVGVIQLPELQIEILPKIDAHPAIPGSTIAEGKEYEARKNLLYMLAVAGDVPVRSRDIAKLTSRKAPLSETLIEIFAKKLLAELLKGNERKYLNQEDNIRTFKGRLLVNRHLMKNAAHRERFFCHYEEFSEDTPMNRIFKAACRTLLDVTRTSTTQDSLRHCLLLLDQVSNTLVTEPLLEHVFFNRQNERFKDLFNFCRLILADQSPTISAGREKSFSLLFDMNKVFERFIASFIQKRVMPAMPDYRLYPQARKNRRYLMKSSKNKGVLSLEPDILIRHPSGKFQVIDTKWKNIGSNGKGTKRGVGSSDLYQLFAYTHRYGCNQSTLLYPQVPGAEEQEFHVYDQNGELSERKVKVRYVNVSRDLHSELERKALANELEFLVREGFSIAPSEAASDESAFYSAGDTA